jgi:hypothetical protein
VSTVTYDTTNKKLTKTINGTTTDVVTVATIKADLGLAASDVGLGNVTNDAQVKRTEMGTASGVATLDANGIIVTSQLPSYVDDVLEYTSKSEFPTTGETGKIYVDTTTNLTWRWSGSTYVEISPSLALGETSSTAYRGDRGKVAYDTSLTAVQSVKIGSSSGSELKSGTNVVIPNATTSAHGAVQLAGSIGSTVASENNKAATEKAVRDAIDDNTMSIVAGSHITVTTSSNSVTIGTDIEAISNSFIDSLFAS